MKIFVFLIAIFLVSSCTKKIEVTSLDQIPGTWKWESSCGGDPDTCFYISKTRYATIDFNSDGTYVEKRNDTIYLQTTYSVIKYDETMGTLVLDNPPASLPIVIMDSRLLITRGLYLDNYMKVK